MKLNMTNFVNTAKKIDVLDDCVMIVVMMFLNVINYGSCACRLYWRCKLGAQILNCKCIKMADGIDDGL